jgi:hypothetical protein
MMTFLKKFLFIFFVVAFSSELFPQLDNSSLFYNNDVDSMVEKKWYAKIQNLNYMKDNEYSGTIADGYTQFGFQLNPQLGYQMTKNLSVEGGIFLMKDFGNDQFTTIAPTFTFRYQKKDFKMIFGNIDGSLNHKLIEPLYNFERLITNRLESGAQFIVNKKRFDLDAWIDWQKAQYRLSNNREKLWVGINANLIKLTKNNLELSLPFQGTILHTGGQLDTSRMKMIRHVNFSAGLVFEYKVNRPHIQNIHLDARYVGAQRELYDTVVFKKNGDGLMANIGITAYNTNLLFTYWYGNNYMSDYGGFLYSSESSSVNFARSYQKFRSLIIMRLTKTIDLAPSVHLTLRLEPYYDINFGFLEYSFGFYINYDGKFRLGK